MHNTAALASSDYDERRRFNRVTVDLLGRFMREDRSEYPCRVENMSPGDVAVVTHVVPRENETVIIYIDHVGRIEALVSRQYKGGFAATIRTTDRKREKLAAQLTWLANRHEMALPEDRRHERVQPRTPIVELVLEDDRRYKVRIVDLSLSGAAIASPVRPVIGSRVTLGRMQGRVVRHLEDGVAIEFAVLQAPDTLEEAFR